MTDGYGTILRDGTKRGLRFERTLAHPPEKVWRAITESEHLQHWLPCDIVGERREGATVELPFWPEHVAEHDLDPASYQGEIVRWEPPSVFEWTWDVDLLRWELIPDADGTRLVFTTWFGDPDRDIARGAAAGYHVCLDCLAELLDTGAVATTITEADVAPLEAHYGELVAQQG